MKAIRKRKIVLVGLLSFVVVSFFSAITPSANGWKNVSTVGVEPETPDIPRSFRFMDRPLPYDPRVVFKYSHYGTHDWIADAALRLLVQQEPDDWSWLLTPTIANQVEPYFNPKYGDTVNHYVERSYVTYLFATQMPDMNKESNTSPRPHKNPIEIDLKWHEGEIIKDGTFSGGTWMGNSKYHSYTWKEIFSGVFVPDINGVDTTSLQISPFIIGRLCDLAKKALTHQEGGESWAKPETAAAWFGIMAHFMGDLCCAPHLISPKSNYYPTNPSFHQKFELNTKPFTAWDGVNGGPKEDFFDIDISKIGVSTISAIPPQVAAYLCASSSVTLSYGYITNGGLFAQKGNTIEENLISNWLWQASQRNLGDPIVTGGDQTYKQFFDRLEKCLINGIYYTAAAMKWTMDVVKKNTVLDCDNWAGEFFHDKYEDIYDELTLPPEDSDLSNSEKSYQRNIHKDWIIFANAAVLAPVFALAIIPVIIISLKKSLPGIPA